MARPRSDLQDLLDRLRSQSEQLALGTTRLQRSLSAAGVTRALSRQNGHDLLQMMPEIGGIGGQLRHLVHGMPHLVFRRVIAPAAKGSDRERRCFFYGAEGPAIVGVDSTGLGLDPELWYQRIHPEDRYAYRRAEASVNVRGGGGSRSSA